MAKRLQVLLDESEWREIRRTAKASQMRVAAIRTAARHEFPIADVATMNEEIERGYLAAGGE